MIEWINLNEKQPPVGVWVLTYLGDDDWPRIVVDH